MPLTSSTTPRHSSKNEQVQSQRIARNLSLTGYYLHSDKDVVRVKDVMDKYLKDHGFESVSHLDSHVQGILKGKELEDWNSLKKA